MEEEIQQTGLQEQELPPSIQAEQTPVAQTAEQPPELKKKRGRPRQDKLVEDPLKNGQAGAGEKKVAKKSRAARKLKLTMFDKDALKLARRGIGGCGEISAHLGVGEAEVAKRFEELERAGLVSRGPENPGKFVLTVKAYNQFVPDSLETTLEEKARRKAEALQKKQEARELKQQKAKQVSLDEQTQKTDENRHAEIIEIAGEERPEKIDLQELLAKGAPRQPSFFAKRMQEKQARKKDEAREKEQTAGNVLQQAVKRARANAAQEGEKCVLCKTDFVLSVSGGNPKYGHCFCGAAYHADCYEGVLQAGAECVQCGKKLDIILDKESLDEVKKIKGVFE